MTTQDCTLFTSTILPALRGTISRSITCCTPPEVVCSSTGITEIKIFDTQFDGVIPPQISQLSQLTILHLYRNKLQGQLPSELGRLPNIVDISIGGNTLEGPIPAELGNARTLENMYFDNNRFTGPIPETLDNLTNLRILFLQNNDFTGPLPPRLRALTPSSTWTVNIDREQQPDFVPPPSTSTIANLPTNTVPTTIPQNQGPPVALIVSLVVGGVVLVIASVIVIIYLRNRADKRLSKRYSQQVGYSQQTLFQLNPTESPSPSLRPLSVLTNTIPPILNQGIPDRIYFFCQGNGIHDYLPILDYIYYPMLLPVTASKPYKPKYPDEVEVTTGDTLVVTEHTFDGWCKGFNQTRNMDGLFPLMCTTPRHPTHLLLIDTRSPLEAFPEKEKIEGARLSFPQSITNKFLFDYPTMDEIRDCLKGKEEEHIQCFISGSEAFIQHVQQILETLAQEGVPIPPPSRFQSVE